MLEEIVFFLGRAICHQIPERTFNINGHYLPVCARDTGIYIGIFSSLLYLYVSKRNCADMIPNKKNSFILLLCSMPLIIDGFGSYLHVYETNNVLRLSTGILFGMSLPFFLMPLQHFSVGGNSKRSLVKIRELFIPLFLATLMGVLVYYAVFPFYLFDLFIIMTLLYWVSLIFFLFYKQIKTQILSISLSVCSSILALAILSKLHDWLL